MSKRKNYNIIDDRPAAKFYYQGTHSHPVRRTVLIIEDLPEMIIGYEMREGNEFRKTVKSAPIKSYRKDRIARYGDYSRIPNPKLLQSRRTTLSRVDLFSLLKEGV